MFWSSHDATYARGSTQYRSILICHDQRQHELALQSADRESKKRRAPIATDILKDHPFHHAEAYHQKWMLRRQAAIWEALLGNYPSEQALIASTVAARLNGYVAGHGAAAQVRRDLDRLGLSTAGQNAVAALAKIDQLAS